MKDIYHRLREKLDDIASGFPATESGVEIQLLKRLFTTEEAALFLKLSPMIQTPDEIAKTCGLDPDQAGDRLEKMAKKGLLFRVRKNGLPSYAAPPYVVGIFEYQLARLDKETAKDMEAYYEEAFGKTMQSFKTPVMRTIPINREVAVKWPVSPYEDVLQILDEQKKIAVAECICRKSASLGAKGIDNPLEVCMLFGSHADYYVENGMGRYISAQEAKEIVKHNDTAGLVMQPFNSQKVGGMCSCSGDYCGMLRSLKKQPVPADAVQSNYFVRVDGQLCVGCETCLDRCHMEAIDMVDEKAVINLDRCIGCGLCVTTCPTEAAQLIQKPADRQYVPPKSGGETYINITMERGRNPLAGNY